MNSGNSNAYTPVLRNPRLFHQNWSPATPRSCLTQQESSQHTLSINHPYPSFQTSPFIHPIQSYQNSYAQLYPYNQTIPNPQVFYGLSTTSYNLNSTTSSSNQGLSLILIATLVLVALDLVFIRPQKNLHQ